MGKKWGVVEMYWRTCSVLRHCSTLQHFQASSERLAGARRSEPWKQKGEKKKQKKSLEKMWVSCQSEGWRAVFSPVMFFLQLVHSNCSQRYEPCKPKLARLANAKADNISNPADKKKRSAWQKRDAQPRHAYHVGFQSYICFLFFTLFYVFLLSLMPVGEQSYVCSRFSTL